MFHLEYFDRVDLEAAVDVVDQPVLAVAAREAAPAACVWHHVQEGLFVASRIPAGEEHHDRVAEVGGGHLVRQHGCQRLDDEVDQEPERAEVPLTRRRLLRPEDRPLRSLHLERLEGAAVDRPLRVDQQLERDAARGHGLREPDRTTRATRSLRRCNNRRGDRRRDCALENVGSRSRRFLAFRPPVASDLRLAEPISAAPAEHQVRQR
jgi:hypothetical protein